jgi:hypothetical protein
MEKHTQIYYFYVKTVWNFRTVFWKHEDQQIVVVSKYNFPNINFFHVKFVKIIKSLLWNAIISSLRSPLLSCFQTKK